MIFEDGTKLVMIGDSITDCGRARPIGEWSHEGLGNGYVSLVDGLLRSVCPDRTIRVVNMGTSGNTVLDLRDRWQADVINLTPSYLSIMIGVNDVWRHFDRPAFREIHIDPDTYYRTLSDLVSSTKPSVRQIFLLSPFYLEPNKEDLMRKMVDEYGQLMKRVAIDTGVVFVDVQAAFDQVLKHLYTSSLSADRVHPNLTGHLVIARAFLQAIGFNWL
ncbi:SGNH/GDSL hydrolase family protein [Alicyclobacillus dauci]|uniref:SGNH/GDSL hydrolase family protein n=1 Tax=Alicyclobacillus dauci TaxID=1475485 RepID=A0ABY6Z4D2_9BACL|nr:SGNH/GDSL hydrolase family protein [Alicyclobacillus dauci]WAH37615.1 SGNH/GDSL hydrolase family protein [Alicyclobacillus dauci]